MKHRHMKIHCKRKASLKRLSISYWID